MDLWLNTYGASIHKNGEMFEIKVGDNKTKISPLKVKSIVLSTSAHISTDVIVLAVKNNIDIIVLDDFGEPLGRFWHSRFGSTAYIRRRQIEIFEEDTGIHYSKKWQKEKINTQINHLKKLLIKRKSSEDLIKTNISKLEHYKDKINQIEGNIDEFRNSMMAYEGNASKLYYDVLLQIIPDEYKFDGRSKRPAKDEFNCMLNYSFGVLYSKIEKSLIIAGLDPYIGILHTDGYNKKSLVYDIIENYRYLCLETVFSLFSQKKVNKAHFDKIHNGLKLNKSGKELLIKDLVDKFDSNMKYNNKNIKIIDFIQTKAHELANELINKGEN